MTRFYQNTAVNLWHPNDVSRDNVTPATIVVDNSSPFQDEMVTEIMAAYRGPNARAPADKDKFLEWLVG